MRGQNAQGEMEEVAAELRQDDEQLRVRFRKNSKSEEPGEGDIVFENTPEEKNDGRASKEKAVEHSITKENAQEKNEIENLVPAPRELKPFW